MVKVFYIQDGGRDTEDIDTAGWQCEWMRIILNSKLVFILINEMVVGHNIFLLCTLQILYLKRFSPLGENVITLEDRQFPSAYEWIQSMLNEIKAVYKKSGMFIGEEIDVIDDEGSPEEVSMAGIHKKMDFLDSTVNVRMEEMKVKLKEVREAMGNLARV